MRGLTKHQQEVLTLVAKPGPGEMPLDLDELVEKLSWQPTKESLQFTIRALVSKGLIEKRPKELRRGRQRVLFRPTRAGLLALDPRGPLEKPSESVGRVQAGPVPGVSSPSLAVSTPAALAVSLPRPGISSKPVVDSAEADLQDLLGELEEVPPEVLIED